MSEPVLVYPSNIDCRKIKCACGNPDCKIGFNFPTEDGIFLTDKYGNEHNCHLSVENIDQLISNLRETRRYLVKQNKKANK